MTSLLAPFSLLTIGMEYFSTCEMGKHYWILETLHSGYPSAEFSSGGRLCLQYTKVGV